MSKKKKTFGNWRPVWEGLPRFRKKVLVLTDYGGTAVCYLRLSECGRRIDWVDAMRAEHSNGSVIAWRELPEQKGIAALLQQYGREKFKEEACVQDVVSMIMKA